MRGSVCKLNVWFGCILGIAWKYLYEAITQQTLESPIHSVGSIRHGGRPKLLAVNYNKRQWCNKRQWGPDRRASNPIATTQSSSPNLNDAEFTSEDCREQWPQGTTFNTPQLAFNTYSFCSCPTLALASSSLKLHCVPKWKVRSPNKTTVFLSKHANSCLNLGCICVSPCHGGRVEGNVTFY